MKKSAIVLMVVAVSIVAACSNSSTDTASGNAGAGALQADYGKICGYLVPLSPADRRDSFAKTCESTYRSYLPACQNAAAVTDCFANIKTWDERLACIDSCKRDTPPRK